MTRWTRADTPTLCGYCQHAIAVGTPVFELVTTTWTKRRCVACVGPAPPDLAPSLPGRSTKPMESMTKGIARMARVNGWVK